MDAAPDASVVAIGAYHHLIGLNGQGDQLFDAALKCRDHRREADIIAAPRCVAVSPDGSRIAVGTESGGLILVSAKGETVSSGGHTTKEEHDRWAAAQKDWNKAKAEHEPKAKAHKEAMAKWKEDDATWGKAAKNGRGPRPEKPEDPGKLPPAPAYLSGRPSPRSPSVRTARHFSCSAPWAVGSSAPRTEARSRLCQGSAARHRRSSARMGSSRRQARTAWRGCPLRMAR